MDYDKHAMEVALNSIKNARMNLDGFIGEREIYENVPAHLVGRAVGADIILESLIKAFESRLEEM